jgi:hypothetical protein
MNGEYPASTAAGRRVLVNEVLPLVLIAWVNLYVLEGAHRLGPSVWIYIPLAALVDVAMLAWTVPAVSRGDAPLTLALPIIATLLLMGILGLAAISHRRGSNRSDD